LHQLTVSGFPVRLRGERLQAGRPQRPGGLRAARSVHRRDRHQLRNWLKTRLFDEHVRAQLGGTTVDDYRDFQVIVGYPACRSTQN
jgi:hypothetical protein